MIKALLFDFGGVLADEGFREGLKSIARRNGLDPDEFFFAAAELIHETGYVTGMCDETDYWNAVEKETGISGGAEELREEILKRFIIRPEMIQYAKKLKTAGYLVAILSDQTNWLDEIQEENPFFHHFDHVFNSFHMGKSKRDPSVFRDVCAIMAREPDEVLFIDDDRENTERALSEGLVTILFVDVKDFQEKMTAFLS